MKHAFSLILVLCLFSACCSAWAESGAPVSQFGFHGWPYRQDTSCQTDGCALGCGRCDSDDGCPSCAYCQGILCTARPAVPDVPRRTDTPAPAVSAAPAARPTAAPTAAPSVSTGDYTTISVTAQEQKVWNLLNRDRQSNGLPALPLDPELSRIARIKSCDMNSQHYFAHESPTYGNAASMLRAFGYAFNGVGENIAHHATVEKAEAAFLSSQGHRGNILGRQWTKVGVGVCVDKNGFVYVTQLFAR
ncbi:MAG: hypothetical protein IK141_03635 [Clostridia bacterium]|nr:hypothetical protein [Clostridia bacterium]